MLDHAQWIEQTPWGPVVQPLDLVELAWAHVSAHLHEKPLRRPIWDQKNLDHVVLEAPHEPVRTQQNLVSHVAHLWASLLVHLWERLSRPYESHAWVQPQAFVLAHGQHSEALLLQEPLGVLASALLLRRQQLQPQLLHRA